MGKAGKARKRRRLEHEVGDAAPAADGDGDTHDDTPRPHDVADAIRALDMLGRRLDLYGSKANKALRVHLHGLLRAQQRRGAHFEPQAWAGQPPPSDAEAQAVLGGGSPCLAALLRVVTGPLGGDAGAERLAASEHKALRRALHPLVLEQCRRDGRPPPPAEDASLSGRVSAAFRNRDWAAALALLRQMAAQGDVPKLGAMQRWVRDCDLATHAGTVAGSGGGGGGGGGDGGGGSGIVAAGGGLPLPSAIMAGDDDEPLGGNDGPQLAPVASSASLSTAPALHSSPSASSAGAHADAAASYTTMGADVTAGGNTALLLLDAVMRAGAGAGAGASPVTPAAAAAAAAAPPAPTPAALLAQRAVVTRAPLFTVLPAWAAAPGGGGGEHARGSAGDGDGGDCNGGDGGGDAGDCDGVKANDGTRGDGSHDGTAPRSPAAAITAAVLGPPPRGWDARAFARGLRVLSHVPGPQRRPPSADDLRIYATAPGAIRFDAEHARAERGGALARHDVPGVPGAFLLPGVLARAECSQLLHAAEAIGFARDGIDGIGAVVWLADESLLAPVFARVRALLPPRVGGCALRGLNARLRLFRYGAGAVYRPHIDGSWPGSGLDASGRLTDDAFPGDERVSRLTFLVYLNGGFDGGATTFFLPGAGGAGHVAARGVQPQAGSVLCFPHGEGAGSLVHEGSAVAPGGAKYIVRTDVLYAARPDGAGAEGEGVRGV